MQKKLLPYIAFIPMFIVLCTTFVPIVFADVAGDTTPPPTQLDFHIDNPLGNTSGVDTLPLFIEKLLEIVILIGIPIVVVFLIYAGFLFVKSQGDQKHLGEAKDALLYAVIGAAILLGAKVIALAIQGTVNDLSS